MIRRLRLASGLTMLAYVATHLLNQSLGLVSVEFMDRVLEVIYETWSTSVGGFILYSAFTVHYCLALWALWLRRSLKMPFAEAAQLVLGFSIPFFLIDHVLNTHVADAFYGGNYGYYQSVLHHYFVTAPMRGGLQLTVLVIAWVHAMIGMWFSLRLKPWYPRWQPLLYAAALLVPTLAIVGILEGAREVVAKSADPDMESPSDEAATLRQPGPADMATIEQMILWLFRFFVTALVAVLIAARASCARTGSAGTA